MKDPKQTIYEISNCNQLHANMHKNSQKEHPKCYQGGQFIKSADNITQINISNQQTMKDKLGQCYFGNSEIKGLNLNKNTTQPSVLEIDSSDSNSLINTANKEYKKYLQGYIIKLIECKSNQQCMKKTKQIYKQINHNPLFKKWNIFFTHLKQSLSQCPQIIQTQSQIEEQNQSLNHAVVYDDEEQILNNKQSQQNIKQEYLSQSSQLKSSSILLSDNQKILSSPLVDLINRIIPDTSSNGKISQFRLSSLEDSSFEVSKHTIRDQLYLIVDSLIRLSHAQTQLTYLCQYKGWRVIFTEGVCKQENVPINKPKQKSNTKTISTRSISRTPKFNCLAEVNVIIKGQVKKFSGYCEIANNKKQAKHNASLLCLYELYKQIEELWYQYEALKMQKPSLIQDENSNNLIILMNAGIYVDPAQFKHMKKNISQNKNDQFQTGYKQTNGNQNDAKLCNQISALINNKTKTQNDNKVGDIAQMVNMSAQGIKEYVEGILAPKRELYYFVAQNKSIYLPPQWNLTKKNNSFWQIECILKYEVNGKFDQISYKIVQRNKKLAENKISRKLLTDVYTMNPILYQKFLTIKKMKNLC